MGVYDKQRDLFVTVSKIGTGLSDRENDKKPEDATTVEELMELYHSQGQRMAR